ncbi:single-stranded-DNA-specific exonuclease RecJ [Candidatus Roizmanbacteria bacterium]|nr:single-stranded-DNA-specific exonuclease RecJ [Candidatus Roizmanbacteria bacterium]
MKIDFKHEIKSEDKITPQQVLNLILKNRQIKDIKEFVNPPLPSSISLLDFDLKYKKQFDKVIKLLNEIKEQNQMIVVYTDYDADGITGGAILWETLHLLGFKVMPYVPDRKKEGYGFSITGIDNVIKQYNPVLIISVDHGITKTKEIKYAKDKRIKVIVTDHHLKAEKIPKADAIFHISALSGSGVAYFFSKEVFAHFKSQTLHSSLLTHNFSFDYLALASIGTIADLVPLVGPSRSVVKYGLSVFPKVNRFGIKHILKQAGIENKEITPYEVGFMIAPRINAIGRLSHAIDALRLLCTVDEKRAYDLAQKIGSTNVRRQELVETSLKEAEKELSKNKKINKIIILKSDHWNEGIIGLIASKLAEKYYRPTIIMTKNDGFYKASARSIPSFHITNFLRSLKKYLVDVGGHAQAAGFTIEAKKLDGFKKEIEKQENKLIKDKDLERIILVDIKIPVPKINLEIVKSLESLEPFGMGNPRPTFYSETEAANAQLFGKTNTHLKVYIENFELIGFNQAEKLKELSRGQKIEIVYTLEIDRWGGREKLRGKILIIR